MFTESESAERLSKKMLLLDDVIKVLEAEVAEGQADTVLTS